MEGEPWKRKHWRHLDSRKSLETARSLPEAPRRHPGGTQEAPQRLPRVTQDSQKAPRKLPEGSQKAPRRLPGGSQEAARTTKAPRGH